MKIVFAGTPEFAAVPLARMLKGGFRPESIFTQPDRPAGRGRKLTASPVKALALDEAIPVQQPRSFRDREAISPLRDIEPDLMIVVAYGLILPAEVLQIPRLGCWNIHASLLPRWRGAAPIQRAIEAGDQETGVCIMQMDEGLDTGPVIHRQTIDILDEETGGSLHDRLAEAGSEALLHCLQMLTEGRLPSPEEQPDSGVTYARKLSKNEAELDWNQPAQALERRIRAFNPWPVAWCMIDDERTRIWKAETTGQRCIGRPGDILEVDPAGILVATGDGALRLIELQRPGGRRIPAKDYINAHPALPRNLDYT
ncbi:MAG TPA: methionyl-tRNA formyltransferase [Xanthomonadales bacterium]|nr:methionyl-tRNA formyltransferase [Xanthomonadales bacterium]